MDEVPVITVEVTARRWVEPLQSVPGSVSVVTQDTLQATGAESVRDAARPVPNLTLPDFSARWLSFPFIRGIGSGRNSPAVTTLIDGVPQLSYATSNLELLDVERIEFLRGPQGSLYGRNTLGGVVNVAPLLPSSEPTAEATATLGDYDRRDVRLRFSGPLGSPDLRGSLALGYSAREGYTLNDTTGHHLDTRNDLFGHGQLLQSDNGPWSLRLSMTYERDRDGDYALGDLAAVRADPHHISHDFEGYNRRDVAQPVLTAIHHGTAADFTSITAWQWWKVRDKTDADFSPLDLLRSGTDEQQHAWIQEFRFSAPGDRPRQLGKDATMRWLFGVFAFTSSDDQDHVTEFSAAAAAQQQVPFPFASHSLAQLRDTGFSSYGQLAFTLHKRLDLTAGLRYDFEHKSADLQSVTDPLLAPPSAMSDARNFDRVSPQLSLGYHLTPDALAYASLSTGYKAGGFNATAPVDKTAFGEENSRNYEAGIKTSWLKNHLLANLCLFRMSWDNMQLDVPTGQPGVFYVDNVGKARSQGAELELTARPRTGLEFFGGVGLLDATFDTGSQSGGVDVGGNRLPFAPRLTWHAGAQASKKLGNTLRGFARLDLQHTGNYFYDAANGAAESGFTVANLHLGVEHGPWRLDGWVNNLFNEHYVPVAFPVPLTPSGYVGESGAPRTVGLTLRYMFP
jgi:iron complex outermembrane receptor protein